MSNRADRGRQHYCHNDRVKGSHKITLYSRNINKNNSNFIISAIITYKRQDLYFLVARHSLKTIFTDTNILLISLNCKTLRRWL
jgi:hypothetical protein